MKTNDGQTIPGSNFVRGATDTGSLEVKTPMDNSTAMGAVDKIQGMDSWQKDVPLDDAGLDADGTCWYKFGTEYGEKAMFNMLPPGMDITNQKTAIFNNMPLKRVTSMGYPGDGAFPVRDIPE